MKSRNLDNIEVLDMLFKTDQFLFIKDEIIKDSLKAVLSCLKIQNDKINRIDAEFYNKINRDEFNKFIKTKVNFSDFLQEINRLKEAKNLTDNNKIFSLPNNNNEVSSSINELNKEIQKLKLEYSFLSQKIENKISCKDIKDIGSEKDNTFITSNDFDNIQNLRSKIEKNESDITNLTVDVQNKLIKIEDTISNIKMNQINKNDINNIIIENIKKFEENNLKNIENEFINIKKAINKQITETVIELNKNNLNDSNHNGNIIHNIKIDLLLKEINSKFTTFDNIIKEITSKIHKKFDKEDIINVYTSIEDLKNKIIIQKNETDSKINKLNDNKLCDDKNNDYEYIIDYFEKEIKNIKMSINDNCNKISKINEELINKKKDINTLLENASDTKINNPNFSENIIYNNNFYPKNDMRYEFEYLKKFINRFMLEVKTENKKSNEEILDTLEEKMNICDINKVLSKINNDLNNKVNLDLYNHQLNVQNEINNFICQEHLLGRWISYKNTPLNNGFIIWNKQLINLSQNNYCFTPDNSPILIKEKGLYLIKIIIFVIYNVNDNNSTLGNVQLVIDRNKIYNYTCDSINKKIFFNEGKNNGLFEDTFIFEECINVKNICRVEVRLDGLNQLGKNVDFLNGEKNNNFNNVENINAILNIISL